MNNLHLIEEPKDYFAGIGHRNLPNPTNILLFLRRNKKKLQQEALQNRSHHRFVLIFNLQTNGTVHVNHLALSLSPEQALLIHPYQFHHFSGLASNELQWLICTFELTANSQLEPLRNRIIDVKETTKTARERLFKEWLYCSRSEMVDELQDGQLQAALTHLLLCLLQNQQTSYNTSQQPNEPANNLLRIINRLLTEWRGAPVTIDNLANRCDISESRLRALFKETAGISLGSYIQNYRINRAMELLRTTRLAISDIADAAGFGSASAFCRTFKKKTGLTPQKYRNNIF